jgi:hypothetical protein
MLLSPLQAPPLVAAPNKQKIPRNFIFCYFNGGWDQLLSLDPRDPGKFPDSKIKQTQIQLGFDRLPGRFSDGTPLKKELLRPSGSNIIFGPAMAPFVKHFDKSCVVRGIMMNTVAHDVGRRYFITGEMPAGLAAKGSSWGTRVVAQQGELTPIPNLVIRVETYNRDLPSFATGLKATSASDLINTLRAGPDSLKGELKKFLMEYRQTADLCDPTSLDSIGMMSLIQQAQKKATTLVDSNLGNYFNFLNKADPTMVGIAKRYGIAGMSDPEAQAALAYQALKHNLAQTVTIELARGLDTHINNWASDQPNTLYRGFKALSQLVDDLDSTQHPKLPGKTLLDNTTIVCFSEFARTPLINNKDGRDHFLVSSALLIGAGVPHNKVIGATSDRGMTGYNVDPITGNKVTSGGVVLTPQNILASLLEGAGYSAENLREKALPCLKVS